MARSTKFLRTLVPLLLLAALLSVNVAPASAGKVKHCANASVEPGDGTQGELAMAALCLLNNERSKRGMVRLGMNKKLTSAAVKHNDDMVDNHYFEHVDPKGRDVVDRLLGTGYIKKALTWLVGENLAWGTEELATPRKIVQAWMRSPGHRRNILTKRFREIGIAVAFKAPTVRGRVAATYTTVFGFRR